jgi:3-hydroxyisobutyrate dehydrogenase-like beta-hydroxyacid dehydrogenase
MTALNDRGINVRELGQDIGRASGMKMLYASLTKGTAALNAAALMAAEALGLSQELATELEESQSQRFRAMLSVTGLSAKALRWVGEMEEIAATYAGAGMPPSFHLGAAEVFRLIAESPIGHERPETIDPHRSLAETVSILTGYAMTLKKQTPEG